VVQKTAIAAFKFDQYELNSQAKETRPSVIWDGFVEPIFDPNHLVDLEPISLKLFFTMKNGGQYFGTGFYVEHQGRAWLITCRHNIEDREFDFTGENDLISMSLIGEGEIQFDESRKVVGISVDGFIPDCGAIELRPNEWQNTPKFDTSIRIWAQGNPASQDIRLLAPPPEEHFVVIKPTGNVIFQGYPGSTLTPVTLRGVRAVPLPTIIQPWMITYLPACAKGFSGGPILNVTNEYVSLLGITTHRFDADVNARTADGRQAEIRLPASAGVPLAPLLWALSQAPEGNSIVPVPPPGTQQFLFSVTETAKEVTS
jgi:hypothetical protein